MNINMSDDNIVIPQKNFSISLYHEHLEEASFLYEQRLSLLDDPEDRFEPHIDRLVAGEELALKVCQKRASKDSLIKLNVIFKNSY